MGLIKKRLRKIEVNAKYPEYIEIYDRGKGAYRSMVFKLYFLKRLFITPIPDEEPEMIVEFCKGNPHNPENYDQTTTVLYIHLSTLNYLKECFPRLLRKSKKGI